MKQSKEQIKKRVSHLIGKKRSEVARKNISEGRKGIKFSDETKNKMSLAKLFVLKGNKVFSPEDTLTIDDKELIELENELIYNNLNNIN